MNSIEIDVFRQPLQKLFNMGEVEAKRVSNRIASGIFCTEAVYTDNIPIAEVLIETLHFDPNEWDQTFE